MINLRIVYIISIINNNNDKEKKIVRSCWMDLNRIGTSSRKQKKINRLADPLVACDNDVNAIKAAL